MKRIFVLLVLITTLMSGCERDEFDIPSNKIYYTTTDGNTISIYPFCFNMDMDGYDVKIISNTYKKGKGIIVFDKEIKNIGEMAFSAAPTLKTITIPPSVTSVDNSAFSGCSSLQAFYGKGASSDNRCLIFNKRLTNFASAGIDSYTIPQGVTSIDGAFRECEKLKDIIIPEGVTWIGSLSFIKCESLTSITLPSTLKQIDGGMIFEGCTSLRDIHVKAVIPPILDEDWPNFIGDRNMFYGYDAYGVIYVPRGSVEAYKRAWRYYDNNIEPMDY